MNTHIHTHTVRREHPFQVITPKNTPRRRRRRWRGRRKKNNTKAFIIVLSCCHLASKFKPLPTHLIIISPLTKFKHNITSLYCFRRQRDDKVFAVTKGSEDTLTKRPHFVQVLCCQKNHDFNQENWKLGSTQHNTNHRNATVKDEWNLTLKLSWSSNSSFFLNSSKSQHASVTLLHFQWKWLETFMQICTVKCFYSKKNWHSLLKLYNTNIFGMFAIWLITAHENTCYYINKEYWLYRVSIKPSWEKCIKVHSISYKVIQHILPIKMQHLLSSFPYQSHRVDS